jgi:hypothetical protein
LRDLKLGKLMLPPSRIAPPCSPPSTNRHTPTPMADLLTKPRHCAKIFGRYGPAISVMTTDSCMDILQYDLPFLGVTHLCKTPVMLFLYNFSCTTTKALDRRTILHASTTSSGSVLLTIYAKYGCIHVTSTIITSYGAVVPSVTSLSAPEPAVIC